MSSEENPWHMTAEREKEWLAELAKQRAALEKTPKYKNREDDINRLAGALSHMAYPDEHLEKPQRSSTVYVLGKATAPENEDHRDNGTFKKRNQLYQALRYYGRYFRGKSAEEIVNDDSYESFGAYRKELVDKAFLAAHWPYREGASLYIYQQMHDRGLSSKPSFEKARWLFVNAPLPKPSSTTLINRGSPSKIYQNSRRYSSVSAYWAAFAVISNSLFSYPENAIHNFICHGDVNEFYGLVDLFSDFKMRTGAQTRTSSKQKSINNSETPKTCHASRTNIPNPLTDIQWAALEKYPPSLKKAVKA